jgi:hypothetical protein
MANEHHWVYLDRSIVQYCQWCGVTWRWSLTLDGKVAPKCEPERYGPYYEEGKYVGRVVREAVINGDDRHQ